jgi:hypothetical protein
LPVTDQALWLRRMGLLGIARDQPQRVNGRNLAKRSENWASCGHSESTAALSNPSAGRVIPALKPNLII